jgi:hypothetical protein
MFVESICKSRLHKQGEYMVEFVCKQGGSIVTFTLEYDIKQMREHPDFVEVIKDKEKKPVVKKPTKE